MFMCCVLEFVLLQYVFVPFVCPLWFVCLCMRCYSLVLIDLSWFDGMIRLLFVVSHVGVGDW